MITSFKDTRFQDFESLALKINEVISVVNEIEARLPPVKNEADSNGYKPQFGNTEISEEQLKFMTEEIAPTEFRVKQHKIEDRLPPVEKKSEKYNHEADLERYVLHALPPVDEQLKPKVTIPDDFCEQLSNAASQADLSKLKDIKELEKSLYNRQIDREFEFQRQERDSWLNKEFVYKNRIKELEENERRLVGTVKELQEKAMDQKSIIKYWLLQKQSEATVNRLDFLTGKIIADLLKELGGDI